MKRLIYLFLVLNFACNSSDDVSDSNASSYEELIIGEWRPDLYYSLCSNGEESITEEIGCVLENRYIFDESGNLRIIAFGNPPCEVVFDITGTWSFIDNELYFNGQEVEYWELNEDRLRIGTDESYNNQQSTCSTNGEIVGYITLTYTEYQRV